jgi:hypothetical protein
MVFSDLYPVDAQLFSAPTFPPDCSPMAHRRADAHPLLVILVVPATPVNRLLATEFPRLV